MSTQFQVDLSFMPLNDILQWVDMNRMSCVLAISLPDDDLIIYMESGKIIFAVSRKSGNGLGEHLVKTGTLGEALVLQSLAECRKNGILFTRYLVDNGIVNCRHLSEVMVEQLEQLLVEIISSKSGTVSISSSLPENALNGPIHLDTEQLLFDAFRIYDEKNRESEKRDAAVEAVSQRLYREEFSLPVMPTMIMQLISIMEDENSTFQDMAKLIMTDQVLISGVLKVANSSFYAGAGKVDSIHYAIVLLGMREIMNIVTAIKINSLGCKDLPQELLQKILDDALKTAFMANGLARHCRQDPEEAFMGGLLLDLGKTVILSVAKDFRIESGLLEDLLTARHTEVGVLIAKKWNYPESIQNLIRYHHTRNLGGIVNPMVALIQISDHVVQNGSEKGFDPELIQLMKLDHATIMDVHTKAIESFNQIKGI